MVSTHPRDAARIGDRVRADVVVIGAGAAGLYAATRLTAGLDVVVVDKGKLNEASGSSPWAQGGLAAAVGDDDSPEEHAYDTMNAGDGLCDPTAVMVLAREAPEHVRALLEHGALFDRDATGALSLAREGGQHRARSVRRADATGAELVRTLRAVAASRVSRLGGIAIALAQDDNGSVSGVWVLADGQLLAVEARAVILASGGCGALFAATTNPDGATGDALSLALHAGAALRDVEFVQFHPTALAGGAFRRLLLTEALRGAGATLHDAHGRRFLVDVHPEVELAPRHIVAGAILAQPDGVAYLDATMIGNQRLQQEFPTAVSGAQQLGFSLDLERVPVSPAAHYHMGGVRTDVFGRTSLPGLYACGEAACTGVHGANRLAGNSLTEALVFGARAAATVSAELEGAHRPLGKQPDLAAAPVDDVTRRMHQLRTRMLADAGPQRDRAALEDLRTTIDTWIDEAAVMAADAATIELHHALHAARAIVHAAALRDESRGGHFRRDAPSRDAARDGVHTEFVRSTRT